MSQLLTFHNNPEIKEKYINRLKQHYARDEITQGYYWQHGRGCGVGCTIHSHQHSKYETELGIPTAFAYVEDYLFERLSPNLAKEFPLEFLNSIPVGVDLNEVVKDFVIWNLSNEFFGLLHNQELIENLNREYLKNDIPLDILSDGLDLKEFSSKIIRLIEDKEKYTEEILELITSINFYTSFDYCPTVIHFYLKGLTSAVFALASIDNPLPVSVYLRDTIKYIHRFHHEKDGLIHNKPLNIFHHQANKLIDLFSKLEPKYKVNCITNTTVNKPIKVLFHANSQDSICPDGFAAAWCAWTVLGETANYIPVIYGEPVPKCIRPGDTVYIVDFSYSREEILALKKVAKEVIILDHHLSAQKQLLGIEGAIFDMNRSGAMLAWNYWHPNEAVPCLIRYVQDRDLWVKKLPLTEEIHLALQTVDKTFVEYDRLNLLTDFVGTMSKIGIPLYQEKVRNVKIFAHSAILCESMGGTYRVAVTKLPINNTPLSDVLNYILNHCKTDPLLSHLGSIDFAANVFYDNAFYPDREYRYSLRSLEDFDVSPLAETFGGGGHPRAAGFSSNAMLFKPVKNSG